MPLPGKSIMRRKRPQEEAEMDITPMIDCTFLLLIFFLVASRMDAPLEIELPPARHGGAVVIKESIIITVAKGEGDQAAIYKGDNTNAKNLMEGSNVVEQEEALARYVEQQANTTPPKRYVLIKGEKGIKHREVARVAKAAARAEVEQLYVAVLEANQIVTQRTCPHCGAALNLPAQFQGRAVRCPACQATFQLDDPLAVPLGAPAVGMSDFEPTPPPVQHRSRHQAEVHPLAPADTTFELPVEYQATSARRPRPKIPRRALPEAEMDMTPMVDVTFLLLIFFMVTASFAMQRSLHIPKPQTDEPSTQVQSIQDFHDNPEYVVVRVDSLNTFHISAAAWPDELEAPSEQELLVKLRQARQGDGQGNVPSKLLVIANGEALHERVVIAVDAGNEVGMEEVQLLTVEEDE